MKGRQRLVRRLAKMPDVVDRRVAAAMEKGADQIVARMRQFSPVLSGELRDSIGWTWGEPPKGVRVIAASKPTGDGRQITIFAGGKGIPQAIFQEFGTEMMPAQPYFYPGYRAERKSVKARIKREMKKGIREAFGK